MPCLLLLILCGCSMTKQDWKTAWSRGWRMGVAAGGQNAAGMINADAAARFYQTPGR
jgi:hypothetical protein